MKFTLKLIAIAALAASSATSFAAIQDATSGNGELLANFRFYAAGDNNTGGDDMSALFDLGVTMDSFLSNRNTAGFTQTWDLTTSNYGGAWSALQTFAGASAANIEFNVIALDNTNQNTAGGGRYLTTTVLNTFPSLANSTLLAFQNTNQYVVANQTRGTHSTEVNGASTGTSLDANNIYFGKVAGTTDGDNWAGQGPDSTARVSVAQNFYYLTNSTTVSSNQATKLAFGYDLNGNGTLDAANNEFGKWTVDAVAGTITFANPTIAPVPEPEAYAMVLAGLGLIGSMVRRRRNRAA
jgi:hypothetical protein